MGKKTTHVVLRLGLQLVQHKSLRLGNGSRLRDAQRELGPFACGEHDDHCLLDNLFTGRKWQREVAERVELDRDLLAHGADQCRLELSVQRVDDDRVVAHLVHLPRLLGVVCLRKLRELVIVLHIRLLLYAIQVFVKAVQHVGHQFVGVLLRVAVETRSKLSDDRLELARIHRVVLARPHRFE